MAKDMIDEIRRAESESGAAIEAAELAAKQRVEKARADALQLIKDGEAAALDQEKKLITEARAQGGRLAAQAGSDKDEVRHSVGLLADKNREKAVRAVIDAIFN